MLRVYVQRAGLTSPASTVKEASLMMRRIIMLLAAAAFMALMMVASAAPAMANHLFDDNDLDHFGVLNDNDLDHFGVLNDHDLFDHDLFDHDNDGRFDDDDDDEDELRTIDVGNLECLVEDEDHVKFCVNEDTNDIVRHVF